MTGKDHVSLSGLFGPIIAAAQGSSKSVDSRTSLRDNLLDADKQRLAKLITPIFNRYDVNHDGAISVVELCFLLKDLHEEATEKSAKMWMNRLDPQVSEPRATLLTVTREGSQIGQSVLHSPSPRRMGPPDCIHLPSEAASTACCAAGPRQDRACGLRRRDAPVLHGEDGPQRAHEPEHARDRDDDRRRRRGGGY